VPKVEREEFLNVGVVLYCADQDFLQIMFELNSARLNAFSPRIDMAEIDAALCSFRQICAGAENAGPIGKLPIAERFRWLTAARSTVVQTSVVHPGLCLNAPEMLEKLFKQLVLE
jgi:hypothetical protein